MSRANLAERLESVGRVADSALGEGGRYALLVDDGKSSGVASHAPEGEVERVAGRFVDSRGASLATRASTPKDRVRWLEEELPQLAVWISDRLPDCRIALLLWFGPPEPGSNAGLFLVEGMGGIAMAVEGFGDWLVQETLAEARRGGSEPS